MFLFLLKCHKVVPTCLMLGNPWIQLFSNGSLHYPFYGRKYSQNVKKGEGEILKTFSHLTLTINVTQDMVLMSLRVLMFVQLIINVASKEF